ncbi:Phosphatidylinositol 3,4,5-trisphosphate 3-phosphatase TPTE2 [Microtus ochrogaster]|uniref:Phosphatidylinositol 3,4,5-trisphosphate 3-phosphatase TPTE2 n=1 Tax=Microtus ochrogaster TaxID=79684 RepID=A0A8J6KY56_MICOH|nr:Phosphatidylinositol 3,4,5-trisphosphate 3-phosphatase TPTE2 [Microtus ochrogaster]
MEAAPLLSLFVCFRIFEIMLIFLDIFLVAIDLHLNKNIFYIPLEYSSVSFAIALFFLVDVLLRVYIEGRQHYFSDLLNTLDAVVIGVTLLIAIAVMFYEKKFLRDVPILGIVFRPLRLFILIRILQLAHQKRDLEKLLRRLVSGNKRRYMKDGFDLDLTYVTGRTGTMVCACLIASEVVLKAKESLYFFGERRTDKTTSSKFQGIETPSQMFHDVETDRVIINVFSCPALYDDVKVKFLSPSKEQSGFYPMGSPRSSLLPPGPGRLYLPRNELDNTHKPKTWNIYSPKFAVEVYFDEV